MAEIAVSVACEVAKCLLAPVGRHCGYVIFSDRCVRQLNVEIKKLGDTRDEVQHSIDDARNNMKPIKAKVETVRNKTWVKEVETVANKAHYVLDYDGRAKKTCFYGWLPNPKARYRLGNESSKMIKEIKDLIEQVQFERVYDENSPPGRVGGAPNENSSAGDGGKTIFKSQASTFQDLMKALDDEKLKVIGIYGHGGVGKTTLLKEVEKKLKKEGRPFHMIVKSNVSQTPDLKKIQDNIAYAFSLKLKDEPSEVGRRDLLCRRLQRDPREKVLIMLDDLWDELNLEAIGIPSGDESRGCKLLLTSRFKDVLEQNMHADRTFRLEGLNDDEAFRLFEKIVGDKLEDEELKSIAAQVVEKLAGLPLLIISIASTLKYSRVSAWKDALIKIEDSNIETIVKLSYDHLKSEDAKSLFLLCALLGGTIQVELLLGLGMGLGLFEGFNNTVEDSRNRLNTMLNSLRSVCLLQDDGDDMETVIIHDLYSEVVVSAPFRSQNSLMMNNYCVSWPKEKLEKCWAICLVNDYGDSLAEKMRCLFPDLKIFVLSQIGLFEAPIHRHDVRDCCGLDFTSMEQLQVLYLRFIHITNLRSSIGTLRNLHSLYLDYCIVDDVAILGKLKTLQILSLAGSQISKLPEEIGELRNLRSLNLYDCDSLMIIEPGALKGLVHLEELYMRGSFSQWIVDDEIPTESYNGRLVELKSLRKLASLEISIHDPIVLLKDDDLPFGTLIRFWINIGNTYGRGFRGLRTMKLQLEGCDGILSKEWVQKTLQKTQHLYLDGLGEFKENAHELCIQGFKQLKHLDIQNSPSIKYIISSLNDLPTAFTDLESLFLENLINLKKICNGLVTPDCFHKLKVVCIEKCHQLKNLRFLSKMQRRVHLEEIKICECDSLQAIITGDAGKVEVDVNDMIELPNVRRLDLRKLPKMTSFCTRTEDAPIQLHNVFPSTIIGRLHNLTIVEIEDCPSLASLFDCGSIDANTAQTTILLPKSEVKTARFPNIRKLQIEGAKCKELWNNRIPNDSFCKLELLRVEHCDNLLLLPHLTLRSCHLIKIIYESDGTNTKSGKMTRLVLRDLENLRHIWQSDGFPNVPFPNLRYVEVVRCSRLEMLFTTFTAKFLGQIKELVVESCEDLELIVGHEECEEAAGTTIIFSELTALRLFELPKIRRILAEKYSGKFPSLQVFCMVSCGMGPDRGLDDWE
ncbi:hypothetical protein EUGRSUZ_G00415, partial [Eucalyptus grandis]